MRSFEGFKRRAVIVVCGDEEQARRRALQESQDGKDVPNIAVYEMKGTYSPFKQISFIKMKQSFILIMLIYNIYCLFIFIIIFTSTCMFLFD